MATPLQYAPWTSDIELAFYSALASLKINHDKLDSSARKVLGLYEIRHTDAPERSTRMQIHGTALTTNEVPAGFYRAEGMIRNFNTIEEYKQVDKPASIEQAGRMIWDAISDGTIYSCPSLLSSFSAICFADLKKYKFNYHFAYPAVHSDPQWKQDTEDAGAISKLSSPETTKLVETVQTWRYSTDARQHGFFLAKRIRRLPTDEPHTATEGRDQQAEGDDRRPQTPRTPSTTDLGFVWAVGSLSSYENGFFNNTDEQDRFVCFADPSTYPNNPGWMLRNLLVLVRQRWHLDKLQVLCYRDTHTRREHPSSIVLKLQSPKIESVPQNASAQPVEEKVASSRTTSPSKRPMPKVTGWERNAQNKPAPRTVDLAAYLDPTRLADQAVDLNLKLIKWRISPSIDLDVIKNTSCLLLGAGTLGSYVARNLMGWGVRKITFVDNGRVSYSNPVRQPLFDFKDCLEGGAKKAERAAEALAEIYPGVGSKGYFMSVPMAGHPILDEERVKDEFEMLMKLIDEHDAIFLLMDSRESRWLPTVMAKAAGKIVINSALGFDTYVVMRHGARQTPRKSTTRISDTASVTTSAEPTNPSEPIHSASPPDRQETPQQELQGEELGCYFCSDVVAPADSLKSATLDQQCTVTRPGIAPLASALAVELLVSILQHPLRSRCPAPAPPAPSSSGGPNTVLAAPPTDPGVEGSHPLGTVPHQLRGFLSTWQTVTVKGAAYDCCSACSPEILRRYDDEGWEFVRRAIGEKGFVEEVSGLAEVQRRAEEVSGDVEWDSEEEEEGALDEEAEIV
ncbi:Autophagy protein 7 [Elasticomyces elasticus]|nr:Autophagy protein 7 [Elasticomyces elasticus]